MVDRNRPYQTMSDTVFLALCIWREARGEPRPGKEAVAMTVLNRLGRPYFKAKTVSDVLFKKWAFSSLTDPRDAQLTTWPKDGDPVWLECIEIAIQALTGMIEHPAPGADHYWDQSIKPPSWATPASFVRKIGRINFHNLDKGKHDGPAILPSKTPD